MATPLKDHAPHGDGKFDFNVSSGAILNLFSRDYHYLHFPGADLVNAQFERLRQEMATLCTNFKPPKNTSHYKDFREGDSKRDPVVFGDVLVSEDGGFKWRLYSFSLQSDLLRIKRPRKNKEYRKEIVYSFKYRAPLLERLREGFPVVTMVKLFFKNGNIFDVRCPKEEDTLAFHRSLKGLWDDKYTRDEIEDRKKAVVALRELAVKSLKGMEHRHVDTFLVLNIVQVVDDPEPTTFFLKTPFKSLKLQVPHNVAKLDWLSALSAILTGNEAPGPETGTALPASATPLYHTKGYSYTAPLHGRLSLVHEGTGKVWKLSGDGPWTIGRSRDNSICLSSDPYLSRHHGKIELQNNVPFIVDQGTRAGLTLNDEAVTVHPLKPGDVVMMAQSRLVFTVTGGRQIFRQDNSDANSNSSGGNAQADVFDDSSGTSFDWSSRSSKSSRSEQRSGRSEETLPYDRKIRGRGPGSSSSFTTKSPKGSGHTSIYSAPNSNSNSQKSNNSSSSSNPSPEETSRPPAISPRSNNRPQPKVIKAKPEPAMPKIAEQHDNQTPAMNRRDMEHESSLMDALESSSSDDIPIVKDKEKEKERESSPTPTLSKSSKGKGGKGEKD